MEANKSAQVLNHPFADEKFSEWVFPIAHGRVRIEVDDNQPLTAERANFMLDAAKKELWEMLSETNRFIPEG